MRKILLVILSALCAHYAISGEPDAPHSSSEWQIWAYSTAGPNFIGAKATVMSPSNTVMSKKDAKDPSQWIESGPHLMLMPKDPQTIANHTADFMSGAPYVMFPGAKYAHLMIPLKNYYKYHKKFRSTVVESPHHQNSGMLVTVIAAPKSKTIDVEMP